MAAGVTWSGDGAAPLASTAAPEQLAAGDVIDGVYQVERQLGVGGHGAVYLVRHRELGGARFALKVVHAGGERAEALIREGRLAAQVHSAHVVKVAGLGRLPRGAPYLVMEYVEGPTLDERVGARALAVAEAVDCGRQLCLALEAAHDQGLVHGDVSLRNLFATTLPDGSLHLQLGDFGLVRRVKSDPATTVSVELEVARGTPRFMAPELVAGGDVDPRSDLFSAGVVLYRLLTGAFPFDGTTTREVLTATLRGQPRPLGELRPEAGAVADVVMRCLELDPATRPASARALREALAAARAAPPPRRRRGRARQITAVAAGVVALAAAIAIAWPDGAPPPPPVAARDAQAVRLTWKGACLTAASAGPATFTTLAPCDRAGQRADQTWLLEADAVASGARDLGGDLPRTQVRTLDGRCLTAGGLVVACSGVDTRLAVRRRFYGNLWTLEGVGATGTRCLRHADLVVDGDDSEACGAGIPPLRWELEWVVPLADTTTITIAGKCLGLVGDDTASADGAPAELRDCAGGPQLDERWQITPVVEAGAATPYVQLRNAWKGLCLEVGDMDLHDVGGKVGVYLCNAGIPNRDSHWRPVEAGGVHRLENRVSGLYATAVTTGDGALVIVDELAAGAGRNELTAPAAAWPEPPR